MKNTKYLFDEEKQTPSGMVSVSQIQMYMACPKKWEYGYVEDLVPRVERSYLTTGKLCHLGMQTVMQTLWEYQDSESTRQGLESELLRKALEAMREEYNRYVRETPLLNEELPDIEQVWVDTEKVFTQALKEFNPMKYDVVSVKRNGEIIPALELHFVVPCRGAKGLHGYIDAILQDRETGFIWCTDYKFRKSLAPHDDEAFNIQNSVYCRACYLMGVPITGTMTWQHINTPAEEPAVLKDGKISRAKIKTTWDVYKQACLREGQDPALYEEEMQAKLGEIEWFRATYEYRNPETVEQVWKDAVIPATKAIAKARKPDQIKTRHMYPWNCKMCQYQSLCQGEIRGYDASAIRLREYTKKVRGR